MANRESAQCESSTSLSLILPKTRIRKVSSVAAQNGALRKHRPHEQCSTIRKSKGSTVGERSLGQPVSHANITHRGRGHMLARHCPG